MLLSACMACYATVASGQEASISPDYETRAQEAIEALGLTGLAVTVVNGDEVLYQETYGVRDITTGEAIDQETLFPFGSIGKAFTTTAFAMLVDEGTVGWDDPVKDFIPDFEMSDPYITREFTIRDLVTHRSGLPLGAGDLLFVPDGDPDIDSILAVLRTIPPSTSFRADYAYDNLLYILAGEVLSRIEGKPWDQVIRERIFSQVGMDDCEALPSKGAAAENSITQHMRTPGEPTPKPVDPRYVLSDLSAPAGGLSCSITDLAKWAQFWLNEATTADGEKLLSDEQLQEVWSGVTITNVNPIYAEQGGSNFSQYALGWSLTDIHGEKMISHGGGVLGSVAHFALVPEEDIAVFVMANDYVPGISSLALQILSDTIAPEDDARWIEAIGAFYDNYIQTSVSDNAKDVENEDTFEPVRELTAYTGTYEDPWYGTSTVSMKDGALYLDMGRSEVLDTALIPVAADKFVARWPDSTLNADAYVMFEVEGDAVTGMTMEAVSSTTDFSFDFHDLDFTRTE
uniref:Serine hydrolase n=1 Tax=Aquisalinus luteolus TaxID=1566827 RepID=A0A8J3ENY0_9PROT|nr:serine hydrolase [Aquisalinus luteolus]